MKRCATTTHLDVLQNSQGVLRKHTLFKSDKFDVTWSYVKRQKGKEDLWICVLFFYSLIKAHNNRKMSPTIRHKYKYIFTLLFKELKADGKVSFLPFAVWSATTERQT